MEDIAKDLAIRDLIQSLKSEIDTLKKLVQSKDDLIHEMKFRPSTIISYPYTPSYPIYPYSPFISGPVVGAGDPIPCAPYGGASGVANPNHGTGGAGGCASTTFSANGFNVTDAEHRIAMTQMINRRLDDMGIGINSFKKAK